MAEMTRDEVLAMAIKAGFTPFNDDEIPPLVCKEKDIQRFAALAFEAGRKAEREECAKVCEQIAGPDGLNVPEKKYFYYTDDGNGCASAIRARSAK